MGGVPHEFYKLGWRRLEPLGLHYMDRPLWKYLYDQSFRLGKLLWRLPFRLWKLVRPLRGLRQLSLWRVWLPRVLWRRISRRICLHALWHGVSCRILSPLVNY
jgi:hypothetical protein